MSHFSEPLLKDFKGQKTCVAQLPNLMVEESSPARSLGIEIPCCFQEIRIGSHTSNEQVQALLGCDQLDETSQ
jgi:hypothetical protein